MLAFAPGAMAENRRQKQHLISEEQGVKEATSAARLVAAKQASSFDASMSKLNAELFPTEEKAVWHHKSPADIRKHWSDVSANAMGKGGDELMRKEAFAASPRAVPAAGKAAVRATQAVTKREQLSAAEQASAEIDHIKAVTEASFPTMKKAIDNKQTAASLAAATAKETNSVFPRRFATEEALDKHLMAKKMARVEKAQAELYGNVHKKLKNKGMMKQMNAVAMAQHRVAIEEKMARLSAQKQKAIQEQTASKKGAAHNNWLSRKMHTENRAGTTAQVSGEQAVPSASSGRKSLSSDFEVPSDGTNIAFRGASQVCVWDRKNTVRTKFHAIYICIIPEVYLNNSSSRLSQTCRPNPPP